MKVIIATVAMLLSCTIFGQTAASADPTHYLNQLHGDTEFTFKGTDKAFLKLGFGICYDILDGISADQLINNLTRDGNFDQKSAARLVTIAIVHLCADPGSIKLPQQQPTNDTGKRRI